MHSTLYAYIHSSFVLNIKMIKLTLKQIEQVKIKLILSRCIRQLQLLFTTSDVIF